MEKYYFVDMGLRKVLLGPRAFDAGHILENVIYLELLRRHRRVYIGKVDNLEVDFVVMDDTSLPSTKTLMPITTVSSVQTPSTGCSDKFILRFRAVKQFLNLIFALKYGKAACTRKYL